MNTYTNNPIFHAIETGRLLHAYILCGEGAKFPLARSIAQKLMCPAMCGHCSQCAKVLSGNHTDIIGVTAASKKHIGVDEIRAVIAMIAERPVSAARRVVIIHNAETMTPGAQNCLLKTLESPPDYAVFLLLCDNMAGLLSTVISRCALIRSGATDIRQEYGDDALEIRDRLLGILSKMPQSNMMVEGYALRADGDHIRLMLSLMIELLRDMLVVSNGKNELCVHTDRLDTLTEISRRFTSKQIQSMMMVLFETESRLASNVNVKSAFDYWFIKSQEVILNKK